MATNTKNEAPEPVNKDIEILYKTVTKRNKDKQEWEVEQPYGKNVPVVLVTSPAAFKKEHEMALWQGMERVIKRHDTQGKIYFEVGKSDDVIEQAIKDAIEILRGLGIQAKRSVEFTPYLSRREW